MALDILPPEPLRSSRSQGELVCRRTNVMLTRGIVLRLGLLAVVAALAVFAFASGGPTQKTEAAGLHPSCTFAPTPLLQVIQNGGSDTVTCTFTIHGHDHTLVVDFTVDRTARPPLTIDGCTLDTHTIHWGPCP
jgi:hypothetical protein